jgi:hypothetical protein
LAHVVALDGARVGVVAALLLVLLHSLLQGQNSDIEEHSVSNLSAQLQLTQGTRRKAAPVCAAAVEAVTVRSNDPI